MCFLGFILYGTLCVSWTWVTISFPMLGKFSTIISSNIFSDPFFFSSSSGTPYSSNVGAFSVVLEVSEIVFNSFFFKGTLFIYLAVLGLCFCARAFFSCGERGPLFIAVSGPLTVVASLVAEHKLQTHRLSSCGSWA